MSITAITRENFKTEVMESDKPVLIDFWASWCGPCRMMSPVVDEIAETTPDVKVCKVNIDDQPDLATNFDIMVIPTLVYMKDGKVVNKSVGVKPKDQIVSMLE